jgi:hypothetical protein
MFANYFNIIFSVEGFPASKIMEKYASDRRFEYYKSLQTNFCMTHHFGANESWIRPSMQHQGNPHDQSKDNRAWFIARISIFSLFMFANALAYYMLFKPSARNVTDIRTKHTHSDRRLSRNDRRRVCAIGQKQPGVDFKVHASPSCSYCFGKCAHV